VPEPEALPSELAALVQLATERRTELAALSEQATAYGQLARVERSRVLPQVSVSGGYNYLENQFLDDEEFAMAGVGVQWALFDGGQSRKRAAAMERNRRAAEDQRADAESLIALQVRQAWLGAEEARQRLQVSADAVERAEENLRIARERYGAGLGTQTQLLEAETLRVQASPTATTPCSMRRWHGCDWRGQWERCNRLRTARLVAAVPAVSGLPSRRVPSAGVKSRPSHTCSPAMNTAVTTPSERFTSCSCSKMSRYTMRRFASVS